MGGDDSSSLATAELPPSLGKHDPTPRTHRKRPLSRAKSEASVYVKVGDNSIVTTSITTELAADIPTKSNNPSSANYFQHFSQKLNAMRDNIVIDAAQHHVDVGLWMYTNEIGGVDGAGVLAHHAILAPTEAPIHADQRSTLTINTGVSRKLGNIDPALLNPYKNVGVISERFVVSAIQPKLNIVNAAAARFLSEYLTSTTNIT